MNPSLILLIRISSLLLFVFLLLSFLIYLDTGTFIPFIPIFKLVSYLRTRKLKKLKVGDIIFEKKIEKYCKIDKIGNMRNDMIDIRGNWGYFLDDLTFPNLSESWKIVERYKLIKPKEEKVTNWRKIIEEEQ